MSHSFAAGHVLPEKLLEGREQNLLWTLERHVPILALLACVDSNRADDKLFLGAHFDKLFLTLDFISKRRHGSRVLNHAAIGGGRIHWCLPINKLTRRQSSRIIVWAEFTVH